jgi:hypothetical protein
MFFRLVQKNNKIPASEFQKSDDQISQEEWSVQFVRRRQEWNVQHFDRQRTHCPEDRAAHLSLSRQLV